MANGYLGRVKKATRLGAEAMGAAALYIACRQSKVPRTFKEIAAATTLQCAKIEQAWKLLMEFQSFRPERMQPEQFLARFCGKLLLGNRTWAVEKAATRLAREATRQGLLDNYSAFSIAAATISASIGNKKLDPLISDVTGVPLPKLRKTSLLLRSICC